ncbi:DNA gyrase inhibitor YacG [Sphingomonas lutea]|uniref:DNA gyrase inhibitor YacG n=1 Tax=Sphingomonas lutea TaxID=1045317 RepID=A0A7G9SI20_9SPHN|nr:DNA gyrase inhibitor YacG [Sphingomonas lutea]QNN67495.1 DNA gyrase inhibitor YacG [Sphingomonas lutea]
MPSRSKPKPCPLCGRAPSPAHAPLCGQGCKDRDLLKWLGEGYRIPGPPAEDSLPTVGVDSAEGES